MELTKLPIDTENPVKQNLHHYHKAFTHSLEALKIAINDPNPDLSTNMEIFKLLNIWCIQLWDRVKPLNALDSLGIRDFFHEFLNKIAPIYTEISLYIVNSDITCIEKIKEMLISIEPVLKEMETLFEGGISIKVYNFQEFQDMRSQILFGTLPNLPNREFYATNFFRRIIKNLIENSQKNAKHANTTAFIEFKIEIFQTLAVFHVIDTGPGFDLQVLEDLRNEIPITSKTGGLGKFLENLLDWPLILRIIAHQEDVNIGEVPQVQIGNMLTLKSNNLQSPMRDIEVREDQISLYKITGAYVSIPLLLVPTQME